MANKLNCDLLLSCGLVFLLQLNATTTRYYAMGLCPMVTSLIPEPVRVLKVRF